MQLLHDSDVTAEGMKYLIYHTRDHLLNINVLTNDHTKLGCRL